MTQFDDHAPARTRTGIDLVEVSSDIGLVVLKCTLCQGRLRVRNDQHPTLAQLVDAMGDHLAVNHPTQFYGGNR